MAIALQIWELTDLPFFVPVLVGLGVGLLAGMVNGSLIAYTGIPPFIATLGMMVTARGIAKWYTRGQPVSMLSDGYAAIGTEPARIVAEAEAGLGGLDAMVSIVGVAKAWRS